MGVEDKMNKKIAGILVITLLITSALPALGMNILNLNSIKLDENEDKPNSLSYTQGTWLLTTKWGQHDPYHEKTPTGSGGTHYRLGCWSVAIGQIIRHHELQSHGEIVLNKIRSIKGVIDTKTLTGVQSLK